MIARDRPVHLAVLCLICSVAALLVSDRKTGSLFSRRKTQHDYRKVSTGYRKEDTAQSIERNQQTHQHPLTRSQLVLVVLAAIVALSSRIEVQRRLLLRSECATRSVAYWLPVIVAVYDALRFQARQRPQQEDEDSMENSVYDDVRMSMRSLLLSSSWRYLPGAIILSLGCYIMSGMWLSSQSNHVCPIVGMDGTWIPRLQLLALVLDSFLAIFSMELATGDVDSVSPILSTPLSWATVLASSSFIWGIIGTVVLFTQPEHRDWILLRSTSSRTTTVLSLFGSALVLTVFLVSTLFSVSQDCRGCDRIANTT